ncbi:hypothetical protein FVQ89_09465 [Homoserinibacter sp. GY 40078]|nr:hypothetical protein FVQ89_09465 [Homoserinibacter sp. GY 40078]
MRTRTESAFDRLHDGVDELVFTDFPDYANVGDSAIALGQAAYWERSGIQVHETFSEQVLPRRVYSSSVPVALNGGGSLGGTYRSISEHRYRMAERLEPDTLLIQEPQSVHFVDDKARYAFRDRMAGREHLRLAVRDEASAVAVADEVDPILVPDAVHLLGAISAPEPVQDVLVLARTDGESAALPPLFAVDWLTDPHDLRRFAWWSRRSRQLPMLKPLFHQENVRWLERARRRLSHGVMMLSLGETIVTDRLHGMLLGLQMGRNVVAIDNTTGKLSAYADTWFGGLDIRLEFADDFPTALNTATRLSRGHRR